MVAQSPSAAAPCQRSESFAHRNEHDALAAGEIAIPGISSHGRKPGTSALRTTSRRVWQSAQYELIAEQRVSFAEVASQAGGVPCFVSASFDRFLRRGVLAQGFACFGCKGCNGCGLRERAKGISAENALARMYTLR